MKMRLTRELVLIWMDSVSVRNNSLMQKECDGRLHALFEKLPAEHESFLVQDSSKCSPQFYVKQYYVLIMHLINCLYHTPTDIYAAKLKGA